MGFNPRTRVGCDKIPAIRDMLITVSIHAPVWGATWIDNKKLSKEWVSIHAPVWGATLVKIRLLLIFCFNPRTRVGCDQFAHLASTTWRVSIHAPVWGATMRHHQVKRAVSFQSTHPCGVRQIRQVIACFNWSFQSTHPCGVRLPNSQHPL